MSLKAMASARSSTISVPTSLFTILQNRHSSNVILLSDPCGLYDHFSWLPAQPSGPQSGYSHGYLLSDESPVSIYYHYAEVLGAAEHRSGFALHHSLHQYKNYTTNQTPVKPNGCLLYTSDAADDLLCVDLGGR